MIKIIHPPSSMKPQLMHLWNTCFEHDEDFCEFFFERHFEPDQSLAVTDGTGKLFAALHYFDGLYQDAEGRLASARYIYGVATYPAHRKRGYASMLLDEMKMQAQQSDISYLYLTAESSAWHLYESLGYIHRAALSRTVMHAVPASEIQWQPCQLAEWERLRGEFLDAQGESFLWRGRELEFMYDDANREGQVLCATFRGQKYYAVVRLREGELSVLESSSPRDQGDLLADSIAARFGWTDCVSLLGRKDEFFSGSKVLSCENIYIGHILSVNGTVPSSALYMNLLAD